MSKYFITGGEGFIGSHLIQRLWSKGHDVVSYGNSARYSWKHLPDLEKNRTKESTCINGDILDLDKLKFSMRIKDGEKPINAIVHLAAIAGVSAYHKRPVDTCVTNGVGTFNVLECARKNCIKKVILISSSEVYGDSNDTEEVDGSSLFTSVHNSRLTYSIGKLFGDTLGIAYHKQFGLDTCILRPFGVFGKAQLGEGCVQIFVRKAISNQDIPVVGDGMQWRDWIYIDDCVSAIESCVSSDRVAGQIMNIGNPNNYLTILELAQKIIELSNSDSKIRFIERNNVRDTHFRQSNINLAKELIGFENKWSLDDALLKTIEWYRENPSIGEDVSF